MKIICVGRNYAQHVLELNNEQPEEPVLFMKPDTAIVPKGNPVFLPDFSNEFHYETEIVLKINRLGKAIPQHLAHEYYDMIGLGLDITARDLQQKLKEKGLPWEKAKAFDFSTVISRNFIPKREFEDLKDINFSLYINGQLKQQGNTKDMIWHFDELVSYISNFFTLRTGDLIFTGTPAGVGKLNRNDILEGFIEDKLMFKTKVK